jgi:hypothetical protein
MAIAVVCSLLNLSSQTAAPAIAHSHAHELDGLLRRQNGQAIEASVGKPYEQIQRPNSFDILCSPQC